MPDVLPSTPRMPTSPRGLATLALLKARFDEGKDHLGLFEPFVADAVIAMTAEHFVATDIAEVLLSRSGLTVPADTVNTLLSRLARRGFLRRTGGRYFRTDTTSRALDGVEFERAVADSTAAQLHLGSALREYAAANGYTIGTDADALAAICAVIADNKVPLVLAEPLPDSPRERSSLPSKLARLVAQFISQRCLDAPDLRPVLQSLLEGIILQDVLFLSDVASQGQRLRGLSVVVDTPILLAAVDLTGIANGIATREGLKLLRDLGATTLVFETTIAEVRRILALIEQRIATAEGRLSLSPTDLVRHVLTTRLSPSDVRTISATLEQRLSAVGLVVRPLPPHDRRYTLDEVALATALKDPRERDADTPRVRHDVDCVAGVLTYRAGRNGPTIDRSHAIFTTTSGRVVRSIQQWYFDQGEAGMPPAVHQLALSNIVWVKRPAASRNLKIHEMAAICAATLKPSKRTWGNFIEHLQGLRRDGVVNDDETVAIIASDLTEPLLSQFDDDVDADADTIQEVIERVQRSYREEADTAAAIAIGAAQADASVARQAAADALADRIALEGRLAARADRIAARAGGILFYAACGILLLAGVLSLPGTFDSLAGGWKWAARIVIASAAAYSIYAQVRGTSVSGQRDALTAGISRLIRERVFGVVTVSSGNTGDRLPARPNTQD